jgi:hypothetical protein
MANIPNPVHFLQDVLKRRKLKAQILGLMDAKGKGMERGLQFEGVTLDKPTPQNFTVIMLLQEILRERRDLGLVQWPGGVSLVNKRDIDALAAEYREPNEKTNFIISGGTDKAADLLSNIAKPTGQYTDPDKQ